MAAADQWKGDIAHDDKPQTEQFTKGELGLAASMSPEKRAQVEKKLKRKLDARCSLFVLIYIMNCGFASAGTC